MDKDIQSCISLLSKFPILPTFPKKSNESYFQFLKTRIIDTMNKIVPNKRRI